MAVDPRKAKFWVFSFRLQVLVKNKPRWVCWVFDYFNRSSGVAMSLWRMKYLKDEGDAINRQLKSSEPSNDTPLGRILSIYKENQGIDPETLELKVDEAILREVPQFEKYHSIIKVFAAVAPLMVSGTVVGMIVTFQALTHLVLVILN